jgi:hypothetical protein
MMTFYSVLSISRWSVVTLHPLLKASPQKFYGRHTESVDKYGVSISTGAPGPVFGGVRVAHVLLVLCVFSFISYVLLVVFVSVFIASSLSIDS